MSSFPEGFVWGAASSAYQVEGAADTDGRGPSIWDVQCRKPGAIARGESGMVACDHYHRYREDVSLMSQIGLHAYRLSISWSRVLPEGVGAVNQKGLDFYDNLVDALLEANIQPYITLFHFDTPHALFQRGGWLNRDIADWFGEYTRVVMDRLSDRVEAWMTFNEPQCFAGFGFDAGGIEWNKPGMQFGDTLLSIHNIQRAHGKSVQAIRAHSKRDARVGWAPVGVAKYPISDSPEDIAAAKEETLACRKGSLWNNTWYSDPVLLGRWNETGLKAFADDLPKLDERDLETIHQPIDFLGLNIYEGQPTKASPDGPVEVAAPPGVPRNRMGWRITPEALYWGPRFHHEHYGIPIYITENGLADNDWVSLDGRVHDPRRIDLASRYLLNLRRAIGEGVDVRGYFHWSIMDNFEWANGYDQRFGLIHVDYETQKRTLKDSAYWYSHLIDTNGAALDDADPLARAHPKEHAPA